jgi:hypothetical protein
MIFYFYFLFSISILTKRMNRTRKNRSNKNKSNKNTSNKNKSNKNKSKQQKKKSVFYKKDFSSGDGFLVSIWGPLMWTYLHIMSFNYPVNPTQEDKKHYRDFILNLQYVLPCKYCRMNLTNNFKTKPLDMCHLESRDTFSRYIYDLHETVNKMLNKKSNLTYCEVRERYEHFRSRCTEEKPKLFDFKKTQTRKKREKGCTEPLYGKKSKCIINIVPQENKSATLKIDEKCIKKRV